MAGAAILALLMSAPQVSAEDEIVIFGGEFEDEATKSKPVEKPAPVKELPKPAEKPKPEEKPAPAPQPKPEIVEPQDKPPVQPQQVEQPSKPELEPQPVEQPTKISSEEDEPAPVEVSPLPPAAPIDEHTTDRRPGQDVERPFTQPTEIPDEPVVIVPPTPAQPEPLIQKPTLPQNELPVQEPSQKKYFTQQNKSQEKLKTLKQRFLKLAVDDTYTYYLDKTSVQWKKMPYSSSEYIADVWVRMIERQPQSLSDDMMSYGADNFNAEISLAREQGYQYSSEDLQVLQSQSYVLEHYYLRPKTNQIQFLCELEVFGRPQNTINERNYDYKNWESLVPGSIESVIYAATIKIIGKGKASERGHMTFVDMPDEYARIALN